MFNMYPERGAAIIRSRSIVKSCSTFLAQYSVAWETQHLLTHKVLKLECHPLRHIHTVPLHSLCTSTSISNIMTLLSRSQDILRGFSLFILPLVDSTDTGHLPSTDCRRVQPRQPAHWPIAVHLVSCHLACCLRYPQAV